MKKDIPLFVLGAASAVITLCCMILRMIPFVAAEEKESVPEDVPQLEQRDIEILSAALVENDGTFWAIGENTGPVPVAEEETAIQEEHNPVPDSVEITMGGGVKTESFYVNAESGTVEVDYSALLREETSLQVQDGGITVLLYHTHTCEAYANEEDLTLTRTDDPEKSVVAVGEAMRAALEKEGISVLHDTTIHDVTYTGSYGRSEDTVRACLEEHPEIDIMIDLHRDALRTADDQRIRPVAVVNGKKAAQVMIITGCDPDGSMELPLWEENLKLALRLQEQLAEISPELARPLFYCVRNYNQNLSPGALLIEVGTDANMLEEAVYSGELLGQALAQTIQNLA